MPANTKIVVEPVVPDAWASDIGHPNHGTANGARWSKFPTSRSNIADDGSVIPGPGRIVNIEDYERTLYPGLIDKYVAKGYCWVVVGSTQRGRAEAQPADRAAGDRLLPRPRAPLDARPTRPRPTARAPSR